MNQGLIGLPLLGSHLAKLAQKFRRQTNSDSLLGHTAGWPADSTHTFQLYVRRFRDIGEINLRVRYMLDALFDSPALR